MSASTTEIPSSIDSDLEPGTVVGEYRVEGRLGQGAFGTVYKGVHPLIGKVVAIKVLARKYSVDPEMVSRFVAEARAVNQIRNRHIIDIFSFGQLEDERQYYVMEFLEGEPLDARLERVGNLSIADALPILRAIAKALDAAHAKGITHRDLKAENVFLGTDSEGALFPKLLDFGIAKLLSADDGIKHKTRTGIAVGTPYYMSPEQCRGKDVDHRTDIYAFGVLMYRVLTGQYPFDADDPMSILMKHFNDDAPPPSTHLPDLPSTIDDVVLWMLAKDPADRPADCRTAVHALEDAA
ncbi:MAG TPA: serine/threonine-protein kinase, partial [Kofleriaceae bacterium]|nr:serine/threonine-protein kinase [Kofleriaceae bacterium]